MVSAQTLLLALAATATAIDVRFYSNANCRNGFAACTNLNPNICCQGSNGNAFSSVQFAAIPRAWNIQCRGHNGGNCNGLAQVEASGGRDTVCLARGPFSGGGYGFMSGRKRGVTSDKNCVRADTLTLADGTKYNLTGLGQASWEKILTLGATAADVSVMPKEYSPYIV